jgi:hypothetical protein
MRNSDGTKKASNTTKKRKAHAGEPSKRPSSKRIKTETSSFPEGKSGDGSKNDDNEKVMINRAPVLQLWSACVAQLVYPKLSWETCLSIGSAISTICAVSKGRSIGAIPEHDDSEKGKKRSQKMEELDVIKVMQFKIPLKRGLALVGAQQKNGKPGTEEPLKRKFGEREYSKVKDVFDYCLRPWRGHEEELNEKAFKMYERFRPQVSSGQRGWGRKGTLSLDTVKSTVER